MFEGAAEFESDLLPRIREVPCFREPTREEIDESYAAYLTGDWDHLCDTWARVAEPTRATVPPHLQGFYDRAGMLPPIMNGLLFLASVRSALAAGVEARQRLRPEVVACITTEFPWLEHRHEHIPPGYTPPFEFPRPFTDFIDAEDLDDVRVRWQLTTAFNEVQQTVYSAHAAQRFRLPALERHAARERELAHNYFGHWAPACTRELWAQSIYVLDALNAAIFDLIVRARGFRLMANSLFGAAFRRGEWTAFERNLAVPQALVPIE
jgi:hypothetical protein